MAEPASAPPRLATGTGSPASVPATAELRLRQMFDGNVDFVWRSLRRLGVPPLTVDDAVQEVFIVANRRIADIELGRERSFLFATALRIASEQRRRVRHRELVDDVAVADAADAAPTPDELADQHRRRQVLDRVLASLELDVRAVFVLHELEEMTMADIAVTLDLPPGTVASRLRRGRDEFQAAVARLRRAP